MREIDFLRGRPAANLACFALPALGANLLQSADQVVDMLVVGAFVGERGLAALANATMVGFVANSLSLGLAVGATVLVSRRLGAGERDGASRAEGAALLVAIALSAAVALPCALLAAPLYAALGVPADALAGAVAYTRVWAAGLPGAFLLSAAGAVMRAYGDARTPMWLAVAVAAVNCAGGVALVPALGVAGTAWSSTAASSLAAALSLAVLAKRRGSTLPARPAARDLAGLARVAAPAAFQQVVVNLSYLAITSMTNALGTAVVAGAGAATKASTLAGMSVWSAGQAVSAAAARCEDAGDRRRALAYARAGLAVSVGGPRRPWSCSSKRWPRSSLPSSPTTPRRWPRACSTCAPAARRTASPTPPCTRSTPLPRRPARRGSRRSTPCSTPWSSAWGSPSCSCPSSATRASSPPRRSRRCCRAPSVRRTCGGMPAG